MFEMSDTKLLYKVDSYLKEFGATVLKSGPRYVILDQTAFYPEGGGQPSDTGTLSFDDETCKVIKVMNRGDQVFHYLDGDIPEGAKVHGVIDWARRFTHMRLHSGEHLLTGLFESACSGPKVFSSFSQLDFRPSKVDEPVLREVERKFNDIIEEDISVEVYYQDRSSLDVGGDERKQEFLEKIPDNIDELRMVKIGSYALTFCMGTHVRSTGEIGRLKELTLESKKKDLKVVYFKLEDVN